MVKPITDVLKIISYIKTKNYTLSKGSNIDIFSFKSINSAKIGDVVTVQECRPMSKSKTWKLLTANEANTSVSSESQENQS